MTDQEQIKALAELDGKLDLFQELNGAWKGSDHFNIMLSESGINYLTSRDAIIPVIENHIINADEKAKEWVKRFAPALIEKLPKSIANVPEFDDKENMAFVELFSDQAFVIVKYISGNRDCSKNGWCCDFFGGVKEGSDEHIKIIQICQSVSGSRFQYERDDDS